MKRINILNLSFTNKTNLCYPLLKKLGSLVLLFAITGCVSIFRPTPVLEEDKSEILKADKQFILLNENLTPVVNPDFTSLDKKLKSLQGAKSFHELNNLAVYGVMLSYIESSEEILKKLQKEKPHEMIPYLNLLRIYYLLDEYEIAKKMLNSFYKYHARDKKKVFEFMKYLKESSRAEEHVLFLDVISNYEEYEMQALQELGEYFISIRDLDLAKPYFEKILTIYAYNPVALHSMMLIHYINESWADVITYATPLRKEKAKDKTYYTMLAKAYFELGEYKLAVKASEEAPESEKTSLDFLTVWRDSILCNDIRASLTPLNKYFQIVKKKNPSIKEEEFFLVSTKEGKRTLSNIINGY
ncbi:MAG: hypothetical protein KBF99_15045 [Leptospiraceae bacterium]|nr:hypothetical protein [Leptospiraceae bacterium]